MGQLLSHEDSSQGVSSPLLMLASVSLPLRTSCADVPCCIYDPLTRFTSALCRPVSVCVCVCVCHTSQVTRGAYREAIGGGGEQQTNCSGECETVLFVCFGVQSCRMTKVRNGSALCWELRCHPRLCLRICVCVYVPSLSGDVWLQQPGAKHVCVCHVPYPHTG